MNYIGTRWYKCDLHLHTPESKCFKDRDTVTPEEWVQAAIDNNLNCVAVTDHNSGGWIDKIKEAAKETPLTVFPGVEITCSDAKVHLLVLFDLDKGQQEVEDFLIATEMPRTDFGEQTAHTNKNIKDIVAIASKHNALVIPAHIDEFNGISVVGNTIREAFLDLEEISSVQVVHKDFIAKDGEYVKAVTAEVIKEYYGRDISEDQQKDWRNSVVQSISRNKAILTFSDNPHEKGESKHGLLGIGTRYTWIKMEESPSLESLRQALLLPNFRVRNDFNVIDGQEPYKLPNEWIESIKVTGTRLTQPGDSIELKFSPQMNTIIGGRGSGKSSALRFLRGVFPHKIADLEDEGLENIKQDFEDFYKVHDARKKKGVLDNGSEVEVLFHKNNNRYKLVSKTTSDKPKTKIYKANESGDWEDETDAFIEQLGIDIFSQKQIYEIGSTTNTLRSRIDNDVDAVKSVKVDLDELKTKYKLASNAYRTSLTNVSSKPALEAELKDLDQQIKIYEESGVKELSSNKNKYDNQQRELDRFESESFSCSSLFNELAEQLQERHLNADLFEGEQREEIEKIVESTNELMNKVLDSVIQLSKDYDESQKSYQTGVSDSEWKKSYDNNLKEFEDKKVELEEQGIEDLSQIEMLMEKKIHITAQIEALVLEEGLLEGKQTSLIQSKQDFISKRKELTAKRKEFLDEILKTDTVKANVKPFRDFDNYEKNIRTLLGAETGHEESFENLVEQNKGRDSIRNNEKSNELILALKEGVSKEGFSSWFGKKVQGLNGEQLDEIALLFPEDEIFIEYKPNKSSKFTPLSNASPGQKSAAILTLLLSHGKTPLVLDQPEDDLDNNLIYDLVVKQLLNSKDNRQVIVVTHNANIPVNGDSENIIVMNSESPVLQTEASGSIENQAIKEQVCKVMEGGTDAFEMRYKRYSSIK